MRVSVRGRDGPSRALPAASPRCPAPPPQTRSAPAPTASPPALPCRTVPYRGPHPSCCRRPPGHAARLTRARPRGTSSPRAAAAPHRPCGSSSDMAAHGPIDALGRLGYSCLSDGFLGVMTSRTPERLQVRDDVMPCLFWRCALQGKAWWRPGIARITGIIRDHPRRSAPQRPVRARAAPRGGAELRWRLLSRTPRERAPGRRLPGKAPLRPPRPAALRARVGGAVAGSGARR